MNQELKDKYPCKIWNKKREERVRKRYKEDLEKGIKHFKEGDIVEYSRYPGIRFKVIQECSDVYIEVRKLDFNDTLEDKLERAGDLTRLVDRNMLKEWRDIDETEC